MQQNQVVKQANHHIEYNREFENRLFCAPPPLFPLNAFPAISRDIIVDTANAYGVPVEVPAIGLLVLAGACIGRTRAIRIKHGWIEFPNLYAALVGISGTGKSPATGSIFRPVHAKEAEWYQEYAEADEEDDNTARRQLIADDSTIEALSEALADNPRGIMWYRDELAGLLLNLDRYGGKSGATKTRLMSSYDSGPWKVTRITKKRNIYIPHATLTIFGTVTPRALPTILSDFDAATGFLPRFLFVRLSNNRPPSWTEKTVTPRVAAIWDWTVEGLLDCDFDSKDRSIIVDVTPDAKKAYTRWYDQLKDNPWTEFEPQFYYPVVAKLRGQCLRIALILHCVSNIGTKESELSPVTEGTMQNAICLSNHLLQHQRQIYGLINSGEDLELSPPQMAIAKAIISLEAEITGGFLSTARIAEVVNEGIDERFRITGRATGKITASMGLRQKRQKDKRGVSVTPEDLTRIKNAL